MGTRCKICQARILSSEEYCPDCAYVMSVHMIEPVTVIVALMTIAIIVITLGRALCG